jgi:hypothetical protein
MVIHDRQDDAAADLLAGWLLVLLVVIQCRRDVHYHDVMRTAIREAREA